MQQPEGARLGRRDAASVREARRALWLANKGPSAVAAGWLGQLRQDPEDRILGRAAEW